MKLLQIWFCLLLGGSLVGCGGNVELLRDLSETEANEVMAALIEAGLSAEKLPGKEGTVSLSIEKSQFSRAISLLNAEGLPHEKYAKMGDVFRKEGMISSPLEERARYLWALSQELSATISQIDGVIKARVHVVLPERSNGAEPALPSSAAVFVKHKPGFVYDDVIPQVKRLVSNSIPGLSQEKVTVIVLPSVTRSDQLEGERKVVLPEVPKVANETGKPTQSIGNKVNIWAACFGLLVALGIAAYFVWKRWSGYGKAGLVQGGGNSPIVASQKQPAAPLETPPGQTNLTDAPEGI
jgi:type III secretion protein J